MSGTSPAGPTPAEHHLGDRLAALVDGELGHDARERVLAHLATCARCKAEADAQRTLKNVFASTAPPPPSEGLLARLQGLPGGPGDPGGDGGGRGGPFDGLFDLGGGIGAVKSDGFATASPVSPQSGFRIHPVGGRPEHDRSPWRGRRFAFAAASAVSFAAIALGGALPLEAAVNAGARGDGTGNNVTPLRSAATGGTGTPAGTGTATNVGTPTGRGARWGERSGERSGPSTLATAGVVTTTPGTVVTGPLVPGALALPSGPPAVSPQRPVPATQSLTELSPFIRPTGTTLRLSFGPGTGQSSGTPSTPAPTTLAPPSPPATPLAAHR
ncbi:anti-sigma factor [Streptomyces sp. NBC_01216]|uniref:anti-sigma factor family protein n=1 Tax=unclassified Streptomyces TaxID=2593676 RepID=UPI002E138788|nr:anti-sigma factor [Streptomyces sp. NBC_01216]